jgi:hypothetical protein
MRSKVSNAIAEMSNKELNQLNELSTTIPELKSVTNMAREKICEFHTQYYRPVGNRDLTQLYNEITDFQNNIGDIIDNVKQKYGLVKPQRRKFKVIVRDK